MNKAAILGSQRGDANEPHRPSSEQAGDAARSTSSPLEQDQRLREVVAAILAGQQERFDEIVEVIGPQVHALAWKMTQNADDALDVSQEALLRIFRALPAWKGRCRFTTWSHRVVMNTAVDFLRRQSKHYKGRIETPTPEQTDEPYEPQEWEGVTTYTAADAVEQSEIRRRIFQAVDLLSPRQRKCFILRHYQDLSVREVAETLKTSEGTVKRHLFRACRRLRELLGTE